LEAQNGWYFGAQMSVRWYKLNPDHSVVPGPPLEDKVAFRAYGDWLYGVDANGRPNKWVGHTETANGNMVSTVFLGLDHSFYAGKKPVLFETMVFTSEGSSNEDQERYCTWEEAVDGHERHVAANGGPLKEEPLTEHGAREYDEIMAAQDAQRETSQDMRG